MTTNKKDLAKKELLPSPDGGCDIDLDWKEK